MEVVLDGQWRKCIYAFHRDPEFLKDHVLADGYDLLGGRPPSRARYKAFFAGMKKVGYAKSYNFGGSREYWEESKVKPGGVLDFISQWLPVRK